MSARQRTPRDQRRRSLGQCFLVDHAVVDRLLGAIELTDDDLVVDVGAGRGALTLPLARTGVRVVAVEADPVWVRRLRDRVRRDGLGDRVRVVQGDLRTAPWPAGRYRVVASPPFGLTTALLGRLLDDPDRGPVRADLVVQWEVARKRAREPATTLRSAGWAPWWRFELGPRIGRRAFRPVPGVDAGVLTIRRRDPPVLPTWLASGFADVLRERWRPPARR